MKPILFSLTFWGCVCMAFVANATGYYSGRGLIVPIPLSANYDTTDINPIKPNPRFNSHWPQILPQPGAKLNYTQIMFEHPQVTGADEYLVEVAMDNGSNSFTRAHIKQKDSSTATMLSNFEFGKK